MKITLQEKILLSPGFRQAYSPADEESAPVAPQHAHLRQMQTGDRLRAAARVRTRPAGLLESEFIRLLTERGIGRPSTYGLIVQTLIDREYIRREAGSLLVPTVRGQEVCAFLCRAYPDLFSLDFSAALETQLDAIAAGRTTFQQVVGAVWEKILPD